MEFFVNNSFFFHFYCSDVRIVYVFVVGSCFSWWFDKKNINNFSFLSTLARCMNSLSFNLNFH